MGQFRYEAVDKTGKVVRGVMSASDENQVTQNLTAMGYSARGVYAAGAATQGTPAARHVTSAAVTPRAAPKTGIDAYMVGSGVPVSIRSKVPIRQLAAFFRQLVSLVRSGIPLYQSFNDLAAYTRSGKLREAIPQMQQMLQSGQPLSAAMAAFPQLFPAHTIASVWCGELSGDLDVILEEVASDVDQESADSNFARVGWWIVNCYTIAMILFMPLLFVGDMVAPVLSDDPALAQHGTNSVNYFLANSVSRFVHVSLPMLAAVIALWLGWHHLKRLPAMRYAIDRAIIWIPIWGKLHRYRSLGRFFRLLDGLYSAGIAPGRAWDAACVAVRNSSVSDKLKQARAVTSATPGMGEMAAAVSLLQPEDIGLIAAGEKTGELPQMLSKLSTIYADQAARQKSSARILSISLLNCAILILGGIGMIIVCKSYVTPMAKFLGM